MSDASGPEPIYLTSEYSGPLVAIYEHLHADDNDEHFWLGQASKVPDGGRILELGCGSGRVLIPLAQAGHRITGVDGSQGMLNALNVKLENEAPEVMDRVELAHASFDTFSANQRFDLIYFSCDTFQHLVGTEVQLKTLRNIRELLAPGGRLIIDTTIIDVELALLSADEEQIHEHPAGDGDTWRLKMTPLVDFKQMRERDLIEIERIRTGPDRSETVVERYRSQTEMAIIFPREMELLIRASGMRVKERLGSYYGDAFSGDDDQFILVATAD